MKGHSKRVRYRLEYLGCRVAAGLIPRLPRRVCLRLADTLGSLFFRFDRRSRAVALENLRLAFGDALDSPARYKIARKSFLNFARSMLDLFWARNLTPANYTRYITPVNFAPALEIYARDGGIIVLSMHAGSHEWLAMTTGFVGIPAMMVALDFKNPALDAVFRTERQRSGNCIIGQHQSLLKMLRAVRRGGGAGLLVDLGLRLNHPGQIIEAFGMKMHVTFLHALLHARTGAAIVPITNVPNPDGTCTVTAHAPLSFAAETSLAEITQSCWDFFEPFIRARPDLWLWNYKHWRYKPLNAGREYPFYAQVSKEFERILAGGPARG
jgi:KDO2-lipid IV(A) lauroyltransferase